MGRRGADRHFPSADQIKYFGKRGRWRHCPPTMFPEGLRIFVGAGSPGPHETPERSGKNGGTGNPSPTMFPEGLGIFVGAGSPGPHETPERSGKTAGRETRPLQCSRKGVGKFVGADAHIRPSWDSSLFWITAGAQCAPLQIKWQTFLKRLSLFSFSFCIVQLHILYLLIFHPKRLERHRHNQ